jgi:hypothetical protein
LKDDIYGSNKRSIMDKTASHDCVIFYIRIIPNVNLHDTFEVFNLFTKLFFIAQTPYFYIYIQKNNSKINFLG